MSYKIQINGKRVDIYLAKVKYLCIHCLGDLRRRDAGLVCTLNEHHYGFIHKSEAQQLTTEERLVKIGDMFPSDYLRGIDVHRPMVVEIEAIKEEEALNRETGQKEPEYVVYFRGMKKKLRLNITMAKEAMETFGSDDTNDWIGKRVTIYRTKVKAFGKEHTVPRIRRVKSGDQPLTKTEKKLEELSNKEFWGKVKNELNIDPVLAGYLVTVAGLANGSYDSSKAPEMWAEIKATGPDFLKLIDEVLAHVPFFDEPKQIIEALKEIEFKFSIHNRLDAFNALAEYANSKADEQATKQEKMLI